MKFNELIAPRQKSAKRLGRGIASGHGKTAGRGTKGQKARTGSSNKPGFSGGQNPLMQKLPKLPGFRSHRVAAENVYTGQLNGLQADKIDATVLADNGLVSSHYVRIKVLAKGDVTKPLTVELGGASAQAIAAIEKAGGSFKAVNRIGRPAKKADKKQ